VLALAVLAETMALVSLIERLRFSSMEIQEVVTMPVGETCFEMLLVHASP